MKNIILLFFTALLVACSGSDEEALVEDILTNIDAPNIKALIGNINGQTVQVHYEVINCGYLGTVDGESYCQQINGSEFCLKSGWFVTADASNAANYPNIISFSSNNKTITGDWFIATYDIPVGATWEGYLIPSGVGSSCPGSGERQSVFQQGGPYYVRYFLSTDFATTYSKPIVLNLN